MRSSAQLLRAARDEARLTQTQLAARTGVPQSLISAYERGRRQPGADMLLRLLAGTGHEVVVRPSSAGSREAADRPAPVVALSSELPSRMPGPLR